MPDFKQTVRPTVADAAQSIEYATGYDAKRILDWFDGASDEDVQQYILGYVQDGIESALSIDPEVDYSS